MTDNTWRPKGFPIRIQGVPYHPFQALRNFVLPIKHDPNWIEDSREVTNTKLSAREWFGLIIHAICLSDKTGDTFLVSTENTGGDGAVVREENNTLFAVQVEQTLATHKEKGELMDTILKRTTAKSSRGKSYAENKHLIVLCNKPGDLVEADLAKAVADSEFDIVNVIAFEDSHQGKHFLSFLFDKENSLSAVHKCPIIEQKLWQAAIDIYNEEQAHN